MTIELCQGQTKNGGQCQRPVLPGNQFCSQHDPDRAEERSEIASLAGRAARPRLVLPDVDATPACPTNVTGIPAFTAKLIDATVRGKLDVRVANSAYYGLGLILKAVETAELERRVAELEQKMALSHHTGRGCMMNLEKRIERLEAEAARIVTPELRYRVIDLMMNTTYQNPAPVREAASRELAKMKAAGIDTVGIFREAALKEIARCEALAKAQAQEQTPIG